MTTKNKLKGNRVPDNTDLNSTIATSFDTFYIIYCDQWKNSPQGATVNGTLINFPRQSSSNVFQLYITTSMADNKLFYRVNTSSGYKVWSVLTGTNLT